MKRLSALVALLVLVTIGGVYAAWSYTGNSLAFVDRTVSHGLTTATTEGDVGVISFVDNNFDLAIDQKAPGDYTAVLKVTGSATIKFVPNPGAPDTVIDNAIPVHACAYTKNADTHKYADVNGEDKEIYVCPDKEIPLTWQKQSDGSFLANISAENLAELVTLGGTFELSTHEEYEAFHEEEENITITIAIENEH